MPRMFVSLWYFNSIRLFYVDFQRGEVVLKDKNAKKMRCTLNDFVFQFFNIVFQQVGGLSL